METPNGSPPTYEIQIERAEGVAIGEHATVIQHPPEPHIDLAEAEKTYRSEVVQKYNRLDFSWFEVGNVPLAERPLEKVFVRLSLTVEKMIIQESILSQKERTGMRRPDQQRRRGDIEPKKVVVQEPITLKDALSTNVLIIGDPGAGKTTLLRWLAVTFAQGYQDQADRLGSSVYPNLLPVLVELGRLPADYLAPIPGGGATHWKKYLPLYITGQDTFSGTFSSLLAQALDAGRCLFLFDGLDEIADRQTRFRLLRSLTELAQNAPPGNRIIIGSRPAGIGEIQGGIWRPAFRRCQIMPFTPDDMQQFFHFWEADTLYSTVQSLPKTLELATTPLLSMILVLLWRDRGSLPSRRVELYEQCCQMLIEQWESHHEFTYQESFAHIDWERHMRLLAPLAYAMHSKKQQTSASRDELKPWLARSLIDEGLCPDDKSAPLVAEQYLATLGLRSGLLQYLGKDDQHKDLYGFPHLTFQEYLAARYIAGQEEQDKIIDLVMAHLHESWWYEVHLLTIGHLSSSSEAAAKASDLLLTILHLYRPPWRIWRVSGNALLRLISPGKYLPQVQLDRRIAWVLAREVELAARGYAECIPDETAERVKATLSTQAALQVLHIFADRARFEEQKPLLKALLKLLQINEEVLDLFSVISDLFSVKPVVKPVVRYLKKHGVSNKTLTFMTAYVLNRLLRAVGQDMQDVKTEKLKKLGVSNEAAVRALVQEKKRWGRLIAESLGELSIGKEFVLLLLLIALMDSDRLVRRGAAVSLGELGVGKKEELVIDALLHALEDNDAWVREAAAESLGRLGIDNEMAANALVHALEKSDVRKGAGGSPRALNVGNEAAISALLHDVQEKDWAIRETVVEILKKLSMDDEAVVNALLSALEHPNINVRRVAAVSLGASGKESKVAADALVSVLQQPSSFGNDDWYWCSLMRKAAALSLERPNTGSKTVLSALLHALQDDDRNMREAAAMSLSKLGVGNEVVASSLVYALQDKDQDVRTVVAASLGVLGVSNETIIDALLRASQEGTYSTREAAAVSLSKLGVGNEEVVNTLAHILREGWDKREKLEAIESLSILGMSNETVINTLLHAMQDLSVREAAVASLNKLSAGNESAINIILQALEDKDWKVRKAAAESLEALGMSDEITEITISALVHTLQAPIVDEATHEEMVREAIVEALGKLGVGSEVVVNALLDVLSHRKLGEVQTAEVESLGKLKIKNPLLLQRVLIALNRSFHGGEGNHQKRAYAIRSIHQLLDDRPLPSYRWVQLQERRLRRLQLKHRAFWLFIAAIMIGIGFVITYQLNILKPNNFVMPIVAALEGMIALSAVISQALSQRLRDPWQQS